MRACGGVRGLMCLMGLNSKNRIQLFSCLLFFGAASHDLGIHSGKLWLIALCFRFKLRHTLPV